MIDAAPWEPELEFGAELAARLVGAQFPVLAPVEASPLGVGWDNAAFLVNGRYVFRFPRRTIAARLIETEAHVLPLFAEELPLPISAPTLVGAATDEYPWSFAGYPAIGGTALSALRLDDDAYAPAASMLGAFLRALHALDAAPLRRAGLPDDTIGRLDGERMMPKMRARVAELEEAGLLSGSQRVLERMERLAPPAPRLERCTVVHGDLYARHVLVDSDLRVCGIIDWGDVHFGDPALDLAIAFTVLPAQARATFFGAYGAVDDRTLELALYRALYHSAMVAHYGLRIGDEDLVYSGMRGLLGALG